MKTDWNYLANLKPNRLGLTRNQFSRPHFLIFVAVFALIGYFLVRSFAAAPLVTSLEAEQMTLPGGSSIITDSTASGGKAVKIASSGTATGNVNFSSSVNSLAVVAKGSQCNGAPTMTVSLDGTSLLTNTPVAATSWTTYSFTPTGAWVSGAHILSVSFNNAYSNTTYRGNSGKIHSTCTRALYLDVTNFYGSATVTPAPTVALSASPASVTAGTASTLTWTSTNASACTASGVWSGSEPTSGSISTGALNQTSTYDLTCTGSGGGASASTTVTVTSSGGGGSASCAYSNTAWCNAINWPVPSFTPTRTINVTSQSAFMTAWSNLQPGDQINVSGVTFTGQVNLTNKNLSNWAQINFDAATKFVGVSTATNDPAVYLVNDSHIRFFGADISDSASSDQAGFGLLVHGNVNYVSWWNFKVHDTGNTALAIFPAEGMSSNLDFKGEVYSWGHNLSWDPHAEKGTGLQGANISDAAYALTNSRVAVYAHDSAIGAGLEMGSDTASSTGNTLYAWCQNLTFVAKSQVSANCIQYWGQNTLNNTIMYDEAENLQGRPFDANGVYDSISTDSIVYGTASNTNLNPYLSSTESGIAANVKWDTRHGPIQLQNVSPLP